MKRTLYFLYYLKQLDWHYFTKFRNHVKAKFDLDISWKDILRDSLKYNISILEYFQFRFFEIPEAEKKNWAGTGFMYEYQLRMNPRRSREKLADKIRFHQVYKPFIRHRWLSATDLRDSTRVNEFLSAHNKVVLKNSHGQCGLGVTVMDADAVRATDIHRLLTESGNDYLESYIRQHDELNRLSPSGLNTVRIITQLDRHDRVQILGARLRISVNSVVDNLAAGNLAAPIDIESGIVTGPAVYSDITIEAEAIHPVTGELIDGFQVPYWQETLALAKRAALHDISNRSIGWDVAITDEGPELLEGNHDWCKLLWQLPVRKGLKHMLVPHLNELN